MGLPGHYAGKHQTINWLLVAAFILWMVELLICRRRPRFPRLFAFFNMRSDRRRRLEVFNAKSTYDSNFYVFVPLRNFAPVLAGSVDYAISGAWMMRGALLLGAILFVADLSRTIDGCWVVVMIGLVAGSIAFLRLFRKATGAQIIFLATAPAQGCSSHHFFATYYYHGNAGAFLNLVWPLTAGLAVRAFPRDLILESRSLG